MFDAFVTLAFFSALLLGIFLYAGKLALKGHESFTRVDQQGSSAVSPKVLMEMCYWWFRPVGSFFIKRGISANQISWLSFISGIIAALFATFGLFGLAATWLSFSAILDTVDGIVARETNTASPAGIILDSSLDRYVDFFFLAALLLYYRDSVVLMITIMLAMLGSFMVSYSTAKAEAMQLTPPRGNMKRSDRLVYLILGAFFSSLSIAWWESPQLITPPGIPIILVLIMIAGLANYSAIQRLIALAKAAEARVS